MPLEVHLRRGHQVRLITHLSMYSLTVHRVVGRLQGQLNHKDVRRFSNQRVLITYMRSIRTSTADFSLLVLEKSILQTLEEIMKHHALDFLICV